MSFLIDLGDALNAFLSAKYNTLTVNSESWAAVVARELLNAVTVPVPWLRSIVDVIDDATSTRSVTLPRLGGEGAMIVYARSVKVPEIHYPATVAHEHEHARVLKARPDLQVIVDYTDDELRATAEARAYACGAFTKYLLTGVLPLVDDVIFPLTSGYGLTVKALSTARTLIQADLSMMESGVVPPHTICEDVLVFLRTRYPQAILVKSFQA